MAINQAKKPIFIFSTTYLSFVGGAEISVSVKEITQRLPNYHFDMITAKIRPGLAKFKKIGNLNVYRVGIGFDKFLLPLSGLLKARKLEIIKSFPLTERRG